MPPRQDVAERVRLLLAERDARPGDRLPPERELATRLGISRSSLREGLRRLADLGIIEARQGSGTYLAPLDADDLFGVRLQLEPYAARLAAERRDDGDLARLDEVVRELRAEVDDPVRFAEADTRLHAAVTDAAGNVPLRVLLDAIVELVSHSRATTVTHAANRAATVDEVAALVAAIRARDAAAAERAMRRHIERLATVTAG